MKALTASLLSLALASPASAQQAAPWTFAVSGDSRNCGDIVMPAIAQKAQADHAAFYWHLGDFRALYDFDADLLAARHGMMTISQYEEAAWPDFIDQQLAPFGATPVFLAIGNHELVGRTRPELLTQFADWFDAPVLRAQRLLDKPSDHALHGFYHWHQSNVDFITLDNASPDKFDPDQLLWFESILKNDEADPAIRTVVVGMHDALPDSLTTGHSMNESPIGAESGRRVYADLLSFQDRTRKEVQVLASHSHFLLSDPYKTACRKPSEVLSGWIVGTAGAVRYRLPADHSAARIAATDVYGYLLGTVTPEGHITFNFHEVDEVDVSPASLTRYGADTVHQCFAANANDYVPAGPTCPTAP